MQLVVGLVVVALVVIGWVSVCTHLHAWQRARAGQPRTTGRARRPARRAPGLPEGHRPPPGLGPLSPSERFLTAEAKRGLRELQVFLLEQRPA